MADLWSEYQPKLQPLSQQSDTLLRDYLAMAAQAPTFQQRLLDAIKSAGQFPSHAMMRAEYAKNPNLTPLAIEALVSQRGQAGRGLIQDIISRASSGFQQDIASRKATADIAERQRSRLLEEYGLAKEARAPLALSEGQTLFDPTTMKALYTAPKTYKPEETQDFSWLIDYLQQQGLLGAPGAEPTEPKPTTTPTRRGVTYTSPQGQWMWDWETEDWYPVTD